MFNDDVFSFRDCDGIEYSTEPAYRHSQRAEQAEDECRAFLFAHLTLLSDVVHEVCGDYPSPDCLASLASDLILMGAANAD